MAYSELQLFAETEYFHVNNVKLLAYLDDARREWYQFCLKLGVEAVVVHISVDYKKEVFHNDQLSIRTWIKSVGNTSFTLEQRMLNEQTERIVSAKVVLATIDHQSRKKVRVPDEVRKLLDQDIILANNNIES